MLFANKLVLEFNNITLKRISLIHVLVDALFVYGLRKKDILHFMVLRSILTWPTYMTSLCYQLK